MDIEEQYDKIYRYCYFKLYDRQLAQDITQEAFLRFYRQGLSFDNGKERPYLYTIAKNLCIDEFRKQTIDSIEELENGATFDPAEEWIDTLVLRSVVSRLPSDEQELLFLRYVNELPITSICKITGLSRFAVYRRLSKSLKWLKEELKKEGFSE
jgi:RNA polymerase sigma-70 factor (ECF subfamily)